MRILFNNRKHSQCKWDSPLTFPDALSGEPGDSMQVRSTRSAWMPLPLAAAVGDSGAPPPEAADDAKSGRSSALALMSTTGWPLSSELCIACSPASCTR